ncbi:hypothetical protein QJS10_CPB20g01050 [Acorus calamus]|uniref:Uncharacterized protein n=1 Tax=Acorus calamus TaxID=4465 RepID=A0AAV9C8T1_ACOCL|nr:hypothetical protein QJS10_CPB20g01050 [Acorus calamus]
MEGLSKKKELKAKDLREVWEEVDIGGGETNTGVGGTSTEVESDSVAKRPHVENAEEEVFPKCGLIRRGEPSMTLSTSSRFLDVDDDMHDIDEGDDVLDDETYDDVSNASIEWESD